MKPEPLFLGIEIGGTKLQLATGDGNGRIQQKKRLTVQPNRGATGIREQMATTIREWAIQPQAVGVGFGGPVDWQTGKIAVSHQIAGWADFELADWLTKLVNAPVLVDNDANVATLAEAHFGAGQSHSHVFYITLGSGVGGGLVVHGQIYHGITPGEVEVGHLRLDQSGATLESRCSGWAVDQRIRDAIRQEPHSLLAQPVGDNSTGEARFLKAALAGGDALAVRILEEIATDLAVGLSHVVHLLHPDVLILGGGLSLVGEPLRETVQRKLPALLMPSFRTNLAVKLAALGEDAVPIGALALARQKYARMGKE